MIDPYEIAGMVAAEYVGQPVAFEAILGIIREEKEFIIETVCAYAGSSIVGKKIAEIDFEQCKLMLMGVISTHPAHRKHKNRYQLKNQHVYFNPEQYLEVQ